MTVSDMTIDRLNSLDVRCDYLRAMLRLHDLGAVDDREYLQAVSRTLSALQIELATWSE